MEGTRGAVALYCLGWGMTSKSSCMERWALSKNDFEVILFLRHEGEWMVQSHILCYGGGMMPRGISKEELSACLERLTELNDDEAVGCGECTDNGGTDENGNQVFNCSECGCVLSLYDSDGMNNLCTSFVYDYPRYCPECGRRIVGGQE